MIPWNEGFPDTKDQQNFKYLSKYFCQVHNVAIKYLLIYWIVLVNAELNASHQQFKKLHRFPTEHISR